MKRAFHRSLWPWAIVALAMVASPAVAQQKAPAGQAAGSYRKLAPGVMKTVEPSQEAAETVSRHDIVELLAIDPSYTWAKDVAFRRDIWCLQLKFKPVRMIYVDIPQPSGQMRRKLIWYMVYSVTNTGKTLQPVQGNDKTFDVVQVDKPVEFIPEFVLEGHESLDEGQGISKAYADSLIPVAVRDIRLREDPHRRLLNKAEMCRTIAPGETLWGVATWEDVDPRIDRFSVYVKGLTNAYKWKDPAEGLQKGDPLGKGRQLRMKTLKINFWRPGDEYFEHEREIRYGIPGEVDYEWVYR